MAIDLEDQKTWENARNFMELLRYIPAQFSSTIRILIGNHNRNKDENRTTFNSESRFSMLRLLRSPLVLSPFYFAIKSLHPEKFSKASGLTSEQLMNFINPLEAAEILTLLFLFKRFRAKSNQEGWPWIEKIVLESSEVGIKFGGAVSAIGPSLGLLVGTLRPLSLALFMNADNKAFQGYKKACKKKRVGFDFAEEVNIWGCSHAHLCALILQSMGFGVDFSDNFFRGLVTAPEKKTKSESASIRVSALYIEALYVGGEPPQIVDEHEFVIKDSDLDQLVESVDRLREKGPECPWLKKIKADLGGDKSPELLYQPAIEEVSDAEGDIGLDG